MNFINEVFHKVVSSRQQINRCSSSTVARETNLPFPQAELGDTKTILIDMAETPLYGSALSAVLPPGAKDVSLLRQIPDNQEVYCHPFTDQSIIIDLLQYVEESDDCAISVHFEDLSESNGVAPGEARILQVEQIPVDSLSMECQSAWYILGEQNIAKFNETAKNTVQIHMGLFRLPDVTTDILVTLNDPINIDPNSSSHQAVPVSADRWTAEDFKQTLCSLKVLESGIFG